MFRHFCLVFLFTYALVVSLPLCPSGTTQAADATWQEDSVSSQRGNTGPEMSVGVCVCVKASWKATSTGTAQIPAKSPPLLTVILLSLDVYVHEQDEGNRFFELPDVVPKIDRFFS